MPELAPLFGLRNEDLLENFSILTRVFDGQGLSTDSGIHGQRGHTGDYLFAWIGCTTPIEYRVWKTMGKLGSRLLFFEMPSDEQTNDELVSGLAGGARTGIGSARCRGGRRVPRIALAARRAVFAASPGNGTPTRRS